MMYLAKVQFYLSKTQYEETEGGYVLFLLSSSPRRPELAHCLTF